MTFGKVIKYLLHSLIKKVIAVKKRFEKKVLDIDNTNLC